MPSVAIADTRPGDDLFTYIQRIVGRFDRALYQRLIGAANPHKEGDETIGVSAADTRSRGHARMLLANTTIEALHNHPLFVDALQKLIWDTTDASAYDVIKGWRLGDLKAYLLGKSEAEIKTIMPGLNSDVIAAVTKLMSNDEY